MQMQLVNNITYLRSVSRSGDRAEIEPLGQRVRRLAGLLSASILIAALATPLSAQQTEEDAFEFARNLYRQSDPHQAAGLLAKFIRNFPTSPRLADARLLLARSYRETDNCDLAIPLYETFYREHRDDLRTPEARLERAECLQEEGRSLEAAGAFGEIQRLFPVRETAARVLLRAAANYTAASRPEQAAQTYQKIIAGYPGQREGFTARYRLAELSFATGNASSALQLLGQVAAPGHGDSEAASEAPSALLLSGSIHLFLGNVAAAEEDFRRLTTEYAKTAQADSARLAMASFHAENGRHSQAATAYRGAYEKAMASDLKLDARLGLADALRQSGQVEESRKHYRALLQLRGEGHPSYNHIRLGLASSLRRGGDFTSAYNLLTRIIRTAPQSPEAVASYRELGALYQGRGDYNSAITWFDTYLRAGAEVADRDQVKLSLARIYGGIGHLEQAIGLLRELARQTSPTARFAQFELGQILERADQPRQARREYVHFLERFPRDARADKARNRVEYLNEFTVLDRAGYNWLFQEDRLKELGGTPRQIRLFDLAIALYEHHDIYYSVDLLETYVAQYPDNALRSRAHYHLAEGLAKLARQRQLEGAGNAADSLRQLALKEHRILAAEPDPDQWSQRSQLSLIEAEAAAAGDSAQARLETGYQAFLEARGDGDHPLGDVVLLRLGDARRRQASGGDSATVEKIDLAMRSYRLLMSRHPHSDRLPEALYGVGLCHGLRREHKAAADTLQRLLERFPGHPISARVLLDLGQQLLSQNRLPEAVSRFQELLLAYPAFPEKRMAQKQLADTHFAGGDFAAAIGHYERWLEVAERGPASAPVELRLATCYRRVDQLEPSLALISQVVDRSPGSAADSVLFERADLLSALGRGDAAVELFTSLQEAGNAELAAAAGLRAGDLLFSQERYGKAYAAYQPLLETTENANTHGQAVLSLFRLQRLKEARKAAAAFAKRFESLVDWQQRFRLEEGEHYQEARDYERALKLFDKVEEAGGEHAAKAAFNAASILWAINQQAPSEETAVSATEAQLAFVGKYPDSPQAVAVHMRMGDYYFGLGRLPEAIMAYKKVREGQGDVADRQTAAYNVYKGYQKANQYEDAHQAVGRLLREFPEHPQRQVAEMDLASILASKGQYVKAVAHYQRILESASGNLAAETRFSIGEAYHNMGRYDEAIENFALVSFYGAGASAMWINSADFKRGECNEALGRLESALEAYERIVRREGADSDFGSIAQERVIELRLRLEGKASQ